MAALQNGLDIWISIGCTGIKEFKSQVCTVRSIYEIVTFIFIFLSTVTRRVIYYMTVVAKIIVAFITSYYLSTMMNRGLYFAFVVQKGSFFCALS